MVIRYNLIVSDATFLKLLKAAAEKNQTFGKYANDILNRAAEAKPEKTMQRACFNCGSVPMFEVHGANGETIFLCSNHKRFLNIGKGWKDVTLPGASQ